MKKDTIGTVISVKKQRWLKVNKKPLRIDAMDGATFPHVIKIKYVVNGNEYTCKKWIDAGEEVPDKGDSVRVLYSEEKPSKAEIEILNDKNK